MNTTEIMKSASLQTIQKKPTRKLSSINTFSTSSCTPIKGWSLEVSKMNLEVKQRICGNQIKLIYKKKSYRLHLKNHHPV